MKRIPLFIVALLLISCNISPEKKVNQDLAKFTTSADSRLFFKNVRQIYYDRKDQKTPNWKFTASEKEA
jgi:hypothetical protein